MSSSFDRRMKIENAANSDVVLTKDGKKYATASVDELKKLVDSDDKINYNALIGLAVNPDLPSELIRPIFVKLKNIANQDKTDNSMAKSTKTKNIGLREKIRRLLTIHPNLGAADKKVMLTSITANLDHILANPSLTDEELQMYFDNKVLNRGNGGYSFIAFGKLMNAKNINTKLLSLWFNQLKPFADWSYRDNQWYSVVNDYVGHPDCPYEVLEAVVSVKKDDNEGWKSRSERYRYDAVNHKNADEKIKMLAYQHSGDEKYLPQIAKDVFLF